VSGITTYNDANALIKLLNADNQGLQMYEWAEKGQGTKSTARSIKIIRASTAENKIIN
jgi:hypothetical protein